MNVEVTMEGKGGAGSSCSVCVVRRRAGGEGVGGGFDGIAAAWLMAPTDEGAFRRVVRFP